MSTKDTSHEPAFAAPREYFSDDFGNPACMNKRQYAAIKLRVPDSGEEWLDAMIRQSLRDEFAGKAMQAIMQDWTEVALKTMPTASATDRLERMGKRSYDVAEALLKARTDAQDAQ